MADKEAATATPETISKADYEAAVERARRFEGQLAEKEKTLERFKGIDPVKYSAVIEENEILKREGAGTDKTKWEQIVNDAVKKEREAFSGKLSEWENKTKTLEGEVNHYKVVLPAQQILAEKKLLPEQMPLMNMLVEKELFLSPEGVRVKGQDGKPVRSKANPAKEMELGEWADSLTEKFPSAFASTAVPGARVQGKTGTAANGSGITLEKFKTMTEAERRASLSKEQHMDLSAQMLGMSTRQRVTFKTN